MKKIKIGVLGSANIAVRSIIPAILNLPERYKLVGIASRKPNDNEELREQFKCKLFEGYQSILDSGAIDAVYIPLPNSLHFEWVKCSLERGIHVLVEKSLAMEPEQVETLNELASKNQLALIENFQFRFHNQLEVIKDQVKSKAIGDLKYMRSSFEFPPFPDKSNIRYNRALGGGALYDAGAYPIKISQYFLGFDIEVKAASLAQSSEHDVDVSGGAFLKQKEGDLFSEITFGFDNFYRCNVELFGTKGKLSAERVFTAPPGFEAKVNVVINGKDPITIIVPPCNHFENMLKYFYSVIFDDNMKKIECKENLSQSNLLKQLYEAAN